MAGVFNFTVPQGTQGPTGPTGPPAGVSTDSGNIATLGSDANILVPQSSITSMRLRSYNAVGNPNFEVDQRNAGTGIVNIGSSQFILDRWSFIKVGTMTVNATQSTANWVIPGTNYRITSKYLSVVLTGQETSLGASDYLQIRQFMEGPQWRELGGDTHSLSLLVQSSVAPLSFTVSLRDAQGGTTKSWVHLCTITSVNTPTLITIPNIAVWPTGNFTSAPGSIGYVLDINLAVGSGNMAATADVWQSANVIGLSAMDNWCSKALNSVFSIIFVQHEPGPTCTQLMDLDFVTNLSRCQRYFQRSYDYGVLTGAASTSGEVRTWVPLATTTIGGNQFFQPMAKSPTVTCYRADTGGVNAVYDYNAVSGRAVASVNHSMGGIIQINLTAPTSGAALLGYQYTADTAW
jgi:hypothetical protein